MQDRRGAIHSSVDERSLLRIARNRKQRLNRITAEFENTKDQLERLKNQLTRLVAQGHASDPLLGWFRDDPEELVEQIEKKTKRLQRLEAAQAEARHEWAMAVKKLENARSDATGTPSVRSYD
ncbi:MAG: hypothetical protein K9N51_06710 [Candidatus Pacebacteria bacterium]|nr:hypothetical protein [Candidatus Paceibacterota bacterium]